MPFFSKVFKSKDGAGQTKKTVDSAGAMAPPPTKPKFASTWDSTEVIMDEVQELIHCCTLEMKSRAEALDTPFLLLPFRPEGDVSSARTFIRNYFRANREGSMQYRGEPLKRELRLTEPQVLCSIIKWCWSRIPGGVVSWDIYESFTTGEKESDMVIGSFDAFIPISVDCSSRRHIIYDFFDLLAAISAHAKANGMGGRKLSRMAGWWAFEQTDNGKGLEGGYRTWADAADASSHLYFAYLRSRAPEAVNGIAGISNLPRSLQTLVAQTEYPPETPALMQNITPKVLMFVDSVSPTPFSLLRRARTFEYRSEDTVLQKFAGFRDPVDALTFECRRVLDAIALTNQNTAARSRAGPLASTRLPSGLSVKSTKDETWSRFQDEGFSLAVDSAVQSPQKEIPPAQSHMANMQARSQSRLALGGRPTTPSWADFTNAGFNEDSKTPASPLLFAPEKMLPPIESRQVSQTGPSDEEDALGPGELASAVTFEMDDSFWWVWITSLASEETPKRKASFGRCALVETTIPSGKWLVFEEQIKGASLGPAKGAYIAEKKPRFGFSRRSRHGKKGLAPEPETPRPTTQSSTITTRKGNLTTEQKEKITAAAAALSRQPMPKPLASSASQRRRYDENKNALGAGLSSEIGSAMQWASHYDKDTARKSVASNSDTIKTTPRSAPPVPIMLAKSGAPESTPVSQQVAPEAILPQAPPPAPPITERSALRTPSPPVAPRTAAAAAASSESPEIVSAPPPTESSTLNVDTASQPQNEAATEAPLPSLSPVVSKSPSQSSLPGRKPLSAESAQHVHPAFRPANADLLEKPAEATEPAPTRRAPSPVSEAFNVSVPSQSVPTTTEVSRPVAVEEAKPSSPTEQQKRAPRGPVIKKMFGKKREDWRREPEKTRQAPTSPTEQSLVASSPTSSITPTRSYTPTQTTPTPTVTSASTEKQQPPPQYDLSRNAAHEKPSAVNEFNRFDQGPLDAPAFVPRESLDSSVIGHNSPTNSLPPGQVDNATLQKLQGAERPAYSSLESTDAASFVSATEEQPVPSNNASRWAQIRKNAAERAALAEQEGRDTSAHTERTDDGETSGEETIEERVARIKARVAQLTGNMDRSRPE